MRTKDKTLEKELREMAEERDLVVSDETRVVKRCSQCDECMFFCPTTSGGMVCEVDDEPDEPLIIENDKCNYLYSKEKFIERMRKKIKNGKP